MMASYLPVEADGLSSLRMGVGHSEQKLLPGPSTIQTGKSPLQTLTDFIVGGSHLGSHPLK